MKTNSTFLEFSDHQDSDARIKLYKLSIASSSTKNNVAIETLTGKSNFYLRRHMSMNNDVSKKKRSEQFQTIWIPRRTKETACQFENPLQVKTSD